MPAPVKHHPRLTIASSREATLESFRTTVRNSLGKIANLIGLDAFDRGELMDLAESDRVLAHWKGLLADAPGPAIPEWVWNSHTRAATRTCLAAWQLG